MKKGGEVRDLSDNRFVGGDINSCWGSDLKTRLFGGASEESLGMACEIESDGGLA